MSGTRSRIASVANRGWPVRSLGISLGARVSCWGQPLDGRRVCAIWLAPSATVRAEKARPPKEPAPLGWKQEG